MLGSVELAMSTNALEQTVNLGNTTSNTVQFTNPTTGLVATGNVEVGKELTVAGNTTVSSNLTVSGNVEVGTANLFVDTVNSRVGIGIASPLSRLHVGDGSNPPAGTVDADASLTLDGAGRKKVEQGKPGIYHRENIGLGLHSDYKMSFEVNGSSSLVQAMIINDSGQVGVGTTIPNNTLHISGTQNQLVQIQNTSDTARLVLNGSSGTGGDLIFKQAGVATWGIASIGDSLHFLGDDSTSQTRMTIDNNGKVTIGDTSTKTSDTYLDISSDGGNAYAQGIRLIHHGTDDSNMYGWRIRGDDTDDCFHINRINAGSQLASALTIKSNGIMTTPSRPAFYAWDNISSRSGTTLTFNSTTYNIGSHYNTSTSRFRTPVAGTYIFAAVIAHDTVNTLADVYYSFYVDGSNRRDIIEGTDTHDSHYETHGVYIVNLNADQYVDIRARSGHNITFINGDHGAYYRNCFQGALLG